MKKFILKVSRPDVFVPIVSILAIAAFTAYWNWDDFLCTFLLMLASFGFGIKLATSFLID